MIRRVGDPVAVSGMDSLHLWHVTLSETPEREWRHAFLEHARAVGMFIDAGLRVADATVSLRLDRAHLRVGVEHLDQCIADANAACGLTEGDAGDAAARETEVVLVVDDQSAIVDTVTELLKLSGYTVLCATDPREALRIAMSQHVDLLLTDVVMPVLNGPELARLVLEAKPGIKTIFMSAYAVEEALAWGTPFLAKPFTFDSLTRTVREALDHAATGARTPRASPFSRSAPAAPTR
jgi:CheY-like chemotaxis protein